MHISHNVMGLEISYLYDSLLLHMVNSDFCSILGNLGSNSVGAERNIHEDEVPNDPLVDTRRKNAKQQRKCMA